MSRRSRTSYSASKSLYCDNALYYVITSFLAFEREYFSSSNTSNVLTLLQRCDVEFNRPRGPLQRAAVANLEFLLWPLLVGCFRMSSDGKYDDDEELRPQDASILSSKQLQEELEKRGLKISGFADDDVKLLQKAFNAEFERDRAEKMKQREERLAKRRAEEERQRLIR